VITRREDVILAAMEKTEIFTGRCVHHGKVIANPELSAALADLAVTVARVQKAARATLEQQGGTPLTPGWTIGEAGAGK
jgi:hypothetical protein